MPRMLLVMELVLGVAIVAGLTAVPHMVAHARSAYQIERIVAVRPGDVYALTHNGVVLQQATVPAGVTSVRVLIQGN